MAYVNLCEHIMKFSQNCRIHLRKTEKEISDNNFIAEYMVNKRSIHVFYELVLEIYEMPSE